MFGLEGEGLLFFLGGRFFWEREEEGCFFLGGCVCVYFLEEAYVCFFWEVCVCFFGRDVFFFFERGVFF